MAWERHFVFVQLILTWANERLTKRRQQICWCWSREGISGSLLNKLHIWLYLTGGEFVIIKVLPVIQSLSDRWSPRRTVCNDLMLFVAYLARHQSVACSLHQEVTKQMLMSPREKNLHFLKTKSGFLADQKHFGAALSLLLHSGFLQRPCFSKRCPHCTALEV